MEYPLEKLTGKTIIFYSPKYNRAESWHVFEADDEEETKEAIRAWEALGLVSIGLLDYLDGEQQFEPFDGHTVDEMKDMLPILDSPNVIPPGMKIKNPSMMISVEDPEMRGL
jgi:hypothetical protein